MKRILLVDDGPADLICLQRLLGNSAGEWEVETAASAAGALDKLARARFDVVISDYQMPRMTGEELLAKVALEYPQVVRIILSGIFDARVTSRVFQCAHQYLCKPCGEVELREAVTRALFLRDLLENRDLQRLVSQLTALPSLPRLYQDLLAELQQNDPAMENIVAIVSRDLGLSSKLLQLVNSPFFGLAQTVADVAEAVMHLGLETIKGLVLSVQTFAIFDRNPRQAAQFQALWHHSWSVGQLAQRIAEHERLESSDVSQAFTAGLLHDVGKLVFLNGVPKQYGRVIALHDDEHMSWEEAERQIFGCTHSEVGAYLLGLWGLPISIVEAVAYHHRPTAFAPPHITAAQAVHLADTLVQERDSPDDTTDRLDATSLAWLGGAGRLEQWQELARAEGSGATATASERSRAA